MTLLWSPGIGGRNAESGRCLAQQHQCVLQSQKILEGMEPGEMLPLTLGNRDEDNMCGSRLSKNLT
jgi:hypothetical protein